MNINCSELVEAKRAMEDAICSATKKAMEEFRAATTLTPEEITIHMLSYTDIGMDRFQHSCRCVEATVKI